MKDSIYRALPIVAGHYADMVGVKVHIVKQSTAMTDLNQIWIPDDSREETWGYLIHEAAHCRYTEPWPKDLTTFAASLKNFFEDIFIEIKIMSEFPGTRRDLELLANTVKAKGGFPPLASDAHVAAVITSVVAYHGFSAVRGFRSFDDLFKSAVEVARQRIPAHIDSLLDIIQQSHNMRSSSDALQLTYRVCELFAVEAHEQPEPPISSEDDDQSDQGDPDDDQSDESSQDQNDQDCQDQSENGEADNQGDGESGADSDSNETGSGESIGGGDSDISQAIGSVKQSDLLQDFNDKLREELEAIQQEFIARVIAGDVRPPDEIVIGQLPTSVPSTRIPPGILQEARVASRSLAAELEESLSVFKKGKKSIHSSGRRISSNRVSRVVLGDLDVFSRRSQSREQVDASVVLLVDMSESMICKTRVGGVSDHRFRIANAAALTIALALDSIQGVSLAVNHFARTKHSTVTCTKPFDTPAKHVVDNFWQMPSGSTPMASAMWAAVSQLAERRSTRNLIVCVTDGLPDNPLQTQQVINDSINSGIEVIGIGIQTDSVKDLFYDHVVIDDPSQLVGTLFRVLEQKLTNVA